MKHLKLFESYKSQKELEKLTDNVLLKISEKTYNTFKDNEITFLEDIKLGEIDHTDYGDVAGFIKGYSDLPIHIISPEYIEGFNFTSSGTYLISDDKRYIFIKEDKHFMEAINDLDAIPRLYDNRIVMIHENAKRKYFKSLLHELQHAYDDWRSGEKAIQLPKGFSNNQERDVAYKIKGLENLKEEELDFIGKHYKEYHNLKHEVDARFTAAIRDTDFYSWDIDKSFELNKDVYTLHDFEKVKKSFKSNMSNWKLLNDKEQWRVLRKLGQFYEIEREFVDKLNKEQKEWE